MSMLDDINTAIATVREAEKHLPMIVASKAVLDAVGREYPWYPSRLLLESPLLDDTAYLFDSSLLEPDHWVRP